MGPYENGRIRAISMMRPAAGLACLVLVAASSAAQDEVYQSDKKYSFRLVGDALARQEWTWDIFVSPTQTRKEDRWRLQARPRLEIGVGKLVLGVGGDFNYSKDENTKLAPGAFPLYRDNYDSRDARVDLAFASLKPASWLQVQGGRFVMPIAFTEMVWDRDLRAQGGAVTFAVRDRGAVRRLGVTGLWSRGSHVFNDASTTLFTTAADLDLRLGENTSLEVLAAWMDWSRITTMDLRIRRQNTRVNGQFVFGYKVVDFVARLRFGGTVPVQLVGDLCLNTEVDENRKGIWAAAVLGSLRTTVVRAEYVYADVENDATQGAYGADDFLWTTGWKGHRLDLGGRLTDNVSLHLVGQLQQFYGSPRPAERDLWVKRARAELRFSFGPR